MSWIDGLAWGVVVWLLFDRLTFNVKIQKSPFTDEEVKELRQVVQNILQERRGE